MKEIGTSVVELVHIVTGASSNESVPKARETRNIGNHKIVIAYEKATSKKVDTGRIISPQEEKLKNLKTTLMKQKKEVRSIKKSSLQNKKSTTKLSTPLS